jgi:hypothetical protein
VEPENLETSKKENVYGAPKRTLLNKGEPSTKTSIVFE